MHRMTLGVVIVILLLAGGFAGLYGISFAVDGIVPGVYMGEVELGGSSAEEATARLNQLARRIETTPVRIAYGGSTWETTAGDLGISLNVPASLAEACLVGNTGSIFHRITERQRVRHSGLQLAPVLEFDGSQLRDKVAAAWPGVQKEPENAGFKIQPDDSVVIVPGRMGTSIDFEALEAALEKAVITPPAGDNVNPVLVQLPVRDVAPARSTSDIEAMEINGLIAQYGTRFDAGQADRTYNIKVAAAALDGQLIAPGDEFSFNNVVGPRSSEAGYKSANVIVNNEFVPGLGGGVCQVSSTLYNAVLLANLQVTERSNHTLPVGYVPIGRDATVVYGAVDLKFVNNTDFYIYVRSTVTGNTLTIKLYGNRHKTPKVEIASWVTETIQPAEVFEEDPHLAAGEKVVKQEGKNGYKAAAVRYIWQEGEKVAQNLPASYYHPVKRIVAVGTGSTSPTVVVPLDEELKPPVVNVPGESGPEPPPPDGEETAGEETGAGDEAGDVEAPDEPVGPSPHEPGGDDDAHGSNGGEPPA